MADILLNDASGNPVLVDEAQAQKAMSAGFTPSTPAQQKEFATEQRNQEQYGEGIGNEIKAAGLGALGSATFGLGTEALTKTGLVKPDTIREITERNPVASDLGQVAGIAGSIFFAPEEGAVGAVSAAGKGVTAAAKAILPEAESGVAQLVRNAAAGGLGSAVEGAFYGAGNVINDHALGDPDLNAEKVMSEIGGAALVGGAFGAAFDGIGGLFTEKSAPIAKEAGEASSSAPKGLGEIEERVGQAAASGLSPGELPTKQILIDAEKAIGDSQFPVHEIQLKALDDKNTLEVYKAVKESNTAEGKALRDYESLQKTEAVDRLHSSVDSLSEKPLTADAYKGGEEIVDSFRDDYKARKKQDAEAFQVLKKVAPDIKINQSEIVNSVSKAMPDLNLMDVMHTDSDGVLKLNPYKSSLPISKETYGALKELVEAGSNGILTAEELRNVRNSIGDKITFDLAPRPKAELGMLKKSLMDLLQENVQQKVPDLGVREMFKRYAINEQAREEMEKVFGGKFDENVSLLKQIKPEEVGDKVFRNSAAIQVAKDILPPETFNRLVGNYLKEQIDKFTDQGKFKSQSFANWMKRNDTVLDFAFSDRPEIKNKLRALSDKMRILPDAAPLNPSGTAKAIHLFDAVNRMAEASKNIGHIISEPHKVIGGFFSRLGEKMENKAMIDDLNKVLSGSAEASDKVGKLAAIERVVNKTTNSIASLAKKAVGVSMEVSHAIPGTFILMNHEDKTKEYEKVKSRLDKLDDLETHADALERSTANIYDAAPNVASSMQLSLMRSAQFLKSKLPSSAPLAPLSAKIEPSSAELSKFFRYYEVVQSPSIVLKQLASGTITPESMEAMQAVYPKLLEEMQTKVMERVAEVKPNKIPFRQKMMISAFVGQDLISSMTQAGLAANQMSFAAPSAKQDNIDLANLQKQRPSQKGMESVTLAERSNTATREVTTRRMHS